MIGRLSGTLLSKFPPDVLLDVHGVGYDVQVPMSTFYELPEPGAAVVLLTHFVVREDAQLLYGFLTEHERQHFRELIRVAGVGPRIALAVLSGIGPQELEQAVESQQAGALTRVPGVGKKTAERLLLELKGRLGAVRSGTAGASRGAGTAAAPGPHDDVVRALVALGYSEREAAGAVRALPPDTPVTDGVRHALRALSRAG